MLDFRWRVVIGDRGEEGRRGRGSRRLRSAACHEGARKPHFRQNCSSGVLLGSQHRRGGGAFASHRDNRHASSARVVSNFDWLGSEEEQSGGGVPEAPRASGLERAGCRRRPPNGGKPTGPARGGGGRRPGSLHLGTAQSCLRRVMPATAAVSGTDWRHPLPIRLCGRVGPGERVVAPHGATVVATAVVATTTVAAFVTVPGSPPRSMCLRCTRS